MSHEARLSELGITLPEAPTPMAAYVPALRTGDLLWIAGQPPGGDWRGRVGEDYDVPTGARAARDSGLNILAQVRKAVGSLDEVERVIKVVGFVNRRAFGVRGSPGGEWLLGADARGVWRGGAAHTLSGGLQHAADGYSV